MHRFTIVRPDRAVIVRAATLDQLVVRLSRWTTLPDALLRDAAARLWRGHVVCVPDHGTTLLRDEWRW